MILVIMAAGMGSRYGGLKQLDPVGPSGEFILDYSIFDALKAGFHKVVFIIKKENLELFRDTIGRRIERFVQVEYAFQETDILPAAGSDMLLPEQLFSERVKPWGTAHAVWCCKNFIDSDFAVINADDYYGTEAFRLIADFFAAPDWDYTKAHYCMAGYILGNTLTENGFVARGVCVADGNGYLDSIAERTKIGLGQDGTAYYEEDGMQYPLQTESIVSMNCWGFTVNIFREIEEQMLPFLKMNQDNLLKAEFFLPAVVQESMRNGRCDVKVLPNQDKWFGVTYQEDRPKVKEHIRKLVDARLYPADLWMH